MGNKILFVDDDYNILNLLENFLTMKGFHVETAENGYFALKKLQTFKPDIILLDIMMPRMDGYEVCTKIREYPYPVIARTPILVISALNHLNDVKKAISLGANDYMVKPINLQILFDKIKRYIKLDDVIIKENSEDNLLTLERLDKGVVISIQGELNQKTYELLEKNIHNLPSSDFIILFLQNIQAINSVPSFMMEKFLELFVSLQSVKNKVMAVEQKELFALMESAALRRKVRIFHTLMEAYEGVKKV